MTTHYCVVFCTYPDVALAEKMAQHLVESKLVACANILPQLTSIYFWKNEVQKGNEVLLMMKTRQDKLTNLEKEITANHPYEVAEFIAMPILYGSDPYLNWVGETVDAKEGL